MDYNARWYGPSISRFVSADTIVPGAGNPQLLNRFAYVNNNPLRYTDPTGHWICEDIDCPIRPAEIFIDSVTRTGNLEDPGSGDVCSGVACDLSQTSDPLEIDPTPPAPMSTGEKIGMVATGVGVVVGFTVAEISLGIVGVTVLQLGPAGIVIATLIIVPVELLLIDMEIGIVQYIYESIKAGSREGREFQWTLFEFLNNP